MAREDAAVGWAPGLVIEGKFEVEEQIGLGGMGAVFRVHHREWNLDLAVKVPLPEVVADRQSRERYIREAETWIDLGVHPHIVRCWFVREVKGLPLLFLDYMAGGSLKDWITTGHVAPGNWEMILDLTMQACDGLAYAHSHGVVHRDVKPANLLIRGDERLCVTDFGIVKTTQMDAIAAEIDASAHQLPEGIPEALKSLTTTLTGQGALLGTPEYGAPEQWGNANEAGPAADVYALGVLLYEMCVGRRPFDDGNKINPSLLIGRHLSTNPPDPRDFRSDLPQGLAGVILNCLQKEPEDRPQSMLELRGRLAEVYQSLFQRSYGRPVPKPVEERADALNNKAVSLYSLNKFEEAFTAWRRALDYDSGHCDTIYNVALARWRMGQVDHNEALRRLQHIKSNPAQALLCQGMFWLELGQAERAREALGEAVKDKKVAENGTAHRALGDANMYLTKYYVAEKCYKSAVGLMPSDGETITRKRMATIGRRNHEGHHLFPTAEPCHQFRPAKMISHLVGGPGTTCFTADEEFVKAWDLGEGVVRWSASLSGSSLPVYLDRYLLCDDVLFHAEEGSTVLRAQDGIVAVDDARGRAAVRAGLQVKVVTVPQGQARSEIEAGEFALGCFASKAELLLLADSQGQLRIYNTATGELLHSVSLGAAPTAMLALERKPWLVTGDAEGRVVVWNLAEREVLEEFEHGAPVYSLSTDSGEQVVLVESRQPCRHRVWMLGEGLLREGSGGACLAGESRLLCYDQGKLCLMDIRYGRAIRVFHDLHEEPVGICLTADRRYLGAFTAQGRLLTWEYDEAYRVYERGFLLSRSRSHFEAQLLRDRFQKELSVARRKYSEDELSGALQRLSAARRVGGYGRDPEALELHAELTRRCMRKGSCTTWERRAVTVESHYFDLASQRLAAVCGDGDRVRVLDLVGGRNPQVIRRENQSITAVTASSSGKRVLFAGGSGTLTLWEPDSGRSREFPSQESAWVKLLLAGGDSKAACMTREGRLSILDLESGQWSRTLDCAGSPQLLAVSPTADRALTGPAVCLWDLERGRPLVRTKDFRTRDPRSLEVTAGGFSEDGNFAITAGAHHQLRVWLCHKPKRRLNLEGHQAPVVSASIFSRLRFAVSADRDGTVIIWDLDKGQSVEVLKAHQGGIRGFVAGREGRYYLSWGDDMTLRLWELEWELDPEAPQVTLNETLGGGPLVRLTSFFRRS